MIEDDKELYIIGAIGIAIIIAISIALNMYFKHRSDKNLSKSNFINEWISSNRIDTEDTSDYIKTIEVTNKDTGKKYKLYVHSAGGENPWYGIEEDN